MVAFLLEAYKPVIVYKTKDKRGVSQPSLALPNLKGHLGGQKLHTYQLSQLIPEEILEFGVVMKT